MDSIIYHQNHQAATTYPTHLTEGCINPLRRTSWKQIININSRFRDNYYITPSTDFFVTLPGIPSKVTSMRLVKVTLPNFIYTVNKKGFIVLGYNKYISRKKPSSHKSSFTNGYLYDLNF